MDIFTLVRAPKTCMPLLGLMTWAEDNHGSGPYSQPTYVGIDDSDIVIVGAAQFAIWVSGTEAMAFSYGEPRSYETPNVSFPFKRLASTTSPDRTESYLYHQINKTTIAEEVFIESANSWLASNCITVGESI